MTRLDALTSLRKAVQAGDLSTVSAEHIYKAFGVHYQKRFWEIYQSGSLDAAKALHEAVLPGWTVVLSQNAHHRDWSAFVMFAIYGQIELESRANADDPARAWLLAILEALIAQEEPDDKA